MTEHSFFSLMSHFVRKWFCDAFPQNWSEAGTHGRFFAGLGSKRALGVQYIKFKSLWSKSNKPAMDFRHLNGAGTLATLSKMDMQFCPKILCNFFQKGLAKNRYDQNEIARLIGKAPATVSESKQRAFHKLQLEWNRTHPNNSVSVIDISKYQKKHRDGKRDLE